MNIVEEKQKIADDVHHSYKYHNSWMSTLNGTYIACATRKSLSTCCAQGFFYRTADWLFTVDAWKETQNWYNCKQYVVIKREKLLTAFIIRTSTKETVAIKSAKVLRMRDSNSLIYRVLLRVIERVRRICVRIQNTCMFVNLINNWVSHSQLKTFFASGGGATSSYLRLTNYKNSLFPRPVSSARFLVRSDPMSCNWATWTIFRRAGMMTLAWG